MREFYSTILNSEITLGVSRWSAEPHQVVVLR